MTGDELDALENNEFESVWFSMSSEERSAYPSGFRRYNALHSYVSDGIDRLRHEQPKAIFPNDGAPDIRGADDYRELVERLWEAGLPSGHKTGWPSIDEHYTVVPGQLTILTGWPGAGKSEWLDHLLINLSRQNWKFAIYSAENQPVELHLAKLMEKIAGKPFGAGRNERIAQGEIAELIDDLAMAFKFITPRQDAIGLSDVVKASTDWLLAQDGRIPGLVVDPWNELEHWRTPGKSETEYVSESLSYIRNWARAHGVHVFIVAHPAKQHRENGKLPVPRPDMIAGSQHWWNKADCAITVFRSLDDEIPADHVEIHVQKIRFKNVGKVGMVTLKYDRITGRYHELRNLYAVKDGEQ